MKLDRVIMINMSGGDVQYMQTKLKDFGFLKDKADGNFGQNTLVAVTNFQRAVGLKTDGVVGMGTWSKLEGYNPNPQVVPEVTPTLVDIPLKKSYIGQNGFAIYDCLLNDGEYIKSEVKKDTIWLHHTAGGSRPDWSIGGWENDYTKDKKGNPLLDANGKQIPLKVGTQYVIGRKSSSTSESLWDGKVIRAFDDKYWCLKGDTKVRLLSGKSIEIKDMIKGEKYWIYSCDKNGNIKPGLATGLGITKYVNKLFKITLDNNESFECTDDHRIMMSDGSYKRADEIIESDSIMPMYNKKSSMGYEKIFSDGDWINTHTLVNGVCNNSTKLIKKNSLIENRYLITHHKDFNKLNNDPSNLQWMDNIEHNEYHGRINTNGIGNRWSDVDFCNKMSNLMTERNIENWKDDEYRIKHSERAKNIFNEAKKTKEYKINHRESIIDFWSNTTSEEKHRRSTKMIESKFGNKEERINSIRKIALDSKTIKELIQKSKDIPLRRSDKVEIFKNKNHKVKKIEIVEYDIDIPVYDISVDEYHNFLLDCGIFVHNCYHLGISTKNSVELNSKSVAIEICNYGALTLGRDGRFYNYVNKPVMESEVTEVEFRGYKYWEKYTDIQIESLRRLILYLQSKFGIQIQSGIYNETWFDYNETWFSTGGLRCHSQVRMDKTDIFPQKEMMQMLNSL